MFKKENRINYLNKLENTSEHIRIISSYLFYMKATLHLKLGYKILIHENLSSSIEILPKCTIYSVKPT